VGIDDEGYVGEWVGVSVGGHDVVGSLIRTQLSLPNFSLETSYSLIFLHLLCVS